MSEAVAGLLGAAVGGLVTLLVTWVTGRQQLQQKRLEMEAAERKDRAAAVETWRREKREGYARFLGAYHSVEGALRDVHDLIRAQPDGWRDTVAGIVDDEVYEKNVAELNRSLGWVPLVCDDDRAYELANALSLAQGELLGALVAARKAAVSFDEEERRAVDAHLRAAEGHFRAMERKAEEVRAMLRGEIRRDAGLA